jgi:twinkle protein
MWAVGRFKGVGLFGWEQALHADGKTLFITEGEFDCLALFQVLKDAAQGSPWADRDPPVVSIPNGASGATKAILAQLADIRKRFDKVVIAFDTDEEGSKASEDVAKHIPDVMIAKLPAKDANACLVEGRSKALKSAVVFNSTRAKNTRLVYGSTLSEAARKRPEWGLAWPWAKLTDATRGIRRGETLYFGAGVKMGKSELLNALASNIIVQHNLPVFLVKPEESVVKTYQMLVGKVAGRIFHDPKIEFDEEAFDLASPLVGDKAIIQDVYQFVDWDTLKQDIRYVAGEGVKDIFIDPITSFTNQMSSAEANEHLVSVAAELSSMAKDLDFTAYIFCHLKAPDSGSHERGSPIYSNQFAGSRAMMRACNYMIGMEGNKDPDRSLEERNIRTLVILEDRDFGVLEKIPLYWDHHTGMFNDM